MENELKRQQREEYDALYGNYKIERKERRRKFETDRDALHKRHQNEIKSYTLSAAYGMSVETIRSHVSKGNVYINKDAYRPMVEDFNMAIESSTAEAVQKAIEKRMRTEITAAFGIPKEVLREFQGEDRSYRESLLANSATRTGRFRSAEHPLPVDCPATHTHKDSDGNWQSAFWDPETIGENAQIHVPKDFDSAAESMVLSRNLNGDTKWVPKNDIGGFKGECECGTSKVHGSSCSGRMHSSWCPLYND